MQYEVLEKYTKGKAYFTFTFTGSTDLYGFKIFLLSLVNSSHKVVDKLKTISGSPNAQHRDLIDPKKDYSGSGNPIPEGIYKVGQVIRMNAPEKGVGYVKIPLDVLPDFRVNNRSELLLHSDFNKNVARGSMGCIVTYTDLDMKRIQGWCEQKNRPDVLVVSYGLGLLKSKNIIV